MKKVLINYGGVIIFYLVIFVGIVAISSRLNYVNNLNNEELRIINN